MQQRMPNPGDVKSEMSGVAHDVDWFVTCLAFRTLQPVRPKSLAVSDSKTAPGDFGVLVPFRQWQIPVTLADSKFPARFPSFPLESPLLLGVCRLYLRRGRQTVKVVVVWAGPSRNRTAAYEQTLPHLKCKKHRDTLNSDSKQKCRTSLFGL
jgi:hypothetical protein